MKNPGNLTPREAREIIRRNEWTGPTSGLALGYAQANLVVLPRELAFDFLLFCQRNPRPCPLLEVTETGSPFPVSAGRDADLRSDFPRYNIYRNGIKTDEVTDIHDFWNPDMVGFLLGCSFTFENALMKNRIAVRHIEEGKNVPMFKTNISCRKAGIFEGPMVVSMRPVPAELIARAVQVTSRFPRVHGAPVHIGDPLEIGIKDIYKPDFGDPVTIRKGEVPLFWACGVTPQAVAVNARPELMITHAPGHMFITDFTDDEME
ncbi:MAG: putative hydro-lyase [Oligoflexales bacterium]|nr:putative hydro-lyase [Oligoflexales bacterium]